MTLDPEARVDSGLEELGADDDALRAAVLASGRAPARRAASPAAGAASPARWLVGGAVAAAFAFAWWRLAGGR